MQAKPVLVVGAGPTGLLLALWLRRLGAPVRIIDKDAGPGETSRAMVVQARTLEFYRQLGFADEVVGQGLKVERLALRRAGRLRGAVPFGDFGAGISHFPFALSFPQDEHEQQLLRQLDAAGLAVDRRTELTGFTETAAGVEATLKGPGGDEVFAASYIAGCDGARSTVRGVCGIDLPGGTYARRFYVADAAVEGDAASDSLNVCTSGPDFCLVIPLRRPGMARLIGIVPSDTGEATKFDDVADAVRRNTNLAVKKVNWFSTYHVHHRVAARFRQGRAFLLGDAAHLHSPVGGQGMNTGLGDATNLAWKLAAVLDGRAAPAVLDSYEPERIGFARRLVRTTDRMFQLVTNRGLLGRAWRTAMPYVIPALFRAPGAPRRGYRLISQTDIRYRRGPISQGRAGRVCGGDRLPWLQDVDNYASLTALDWQVHAFGDGPEPQLSVPFHRFAWSDAARRKGFAPGALYLVRPDGYVACAGEAASVRAYLERWGFKPR